MMMIVLLSLFTIIGQSYPSRLDQNMQLQLLLKDYITLIVVLNPQPLFCTPSETNIASSQVSHISSSSVIYGKMLSLTAQDNYHTLTMKRNGC